MCEKKNENGKLKINLEKNENIIHTTYACIHTLLYICG